MTDMTEKQKIAAAIGIVLLAAAFVFLWNFVSCCRVDTSGSNSSVAPPAATSSTPTTQDSRIPSESVSAREMTDDPVPSTPDGVTDDILKNDNESSAFTRESMGESSAASQGAASVDALTKSYDEQPN